MTVQENVNLRPYNTFGLAVTARYFVSLQTTDDLRLLLSSSTFRQLPHLILGGGSNVLFTDDFDGLVARMEIKGINVVAEDDEHVEMMVGAGEVWHEFVTYCVERNLGGIENLSLIPGTVGAAPMQNIGAYGVEVKDVVVAVEGVHKDSGELRTFSNAECKFGYRESIFKQEAKDRYIITRVRFRMTKRDHKLNVHYGAIQETLNRMNVSQPTISDISSAVIQIRRSKLPDPAQVGNAGSFFKNPSITADQFHALAEVFPNIPSFPSTEGLIKVPAGWLIEQCGWKGKRVDDIGVHPHQALVLVNYGGGDGIKIWNLAMEIRDSVIQKFAIALQPEVNVIIG